MTEDMQLRNLTPETQKNYIHHVAGFARYFGKSPELLDLEAVRQYQLYLLHERKLSPETINQYISAVQFLYLTTLEMPRFGQSGRLHVEHVGETGALLRICGSWVIQQPGGKLDAADRARTKELVACW